MNETDQGGYRRFEEFLDQWSRRDFLKRTGAAGAYLAFMAGGVEALAACATNGTPSTGPSATPRKGGNLVTAGLGDVRTFNPVLSTDGNSNFIILRILDGLIALDAKGNPTAVLAKSWKESPDHLTYTFTLRDDARWTDGKPVTSEDVLFTYNLGLLPQYKDVPWQVRGDFEEYVDSFSAPDPTTFVIKLKKVFAPFFLTNTGSGILPKHIFGGMTAQQINNADWNTNPTVTNGAFKFVKWDKGDKVVMARNDGYYRGAPHLDTWTYKILGQYSAVLNQLKTGEVDIGPIDPPSGDEAKRVDSISLESYVGFGFEYFVANFNQGKRTEPFFKDRRVRQALMYALDRETMVKAIYFGFAEIADTCIAPPSWAYEPNTQPRYRLDKKKAADLLDAAGWVKGASGTREKNGLKMSFEITTNAGNNVRQNLVLAMVQAWKELGIDCHEKFVDFNKVLVPSLHTTRDFEVAVSGVSFGIDPDPSGLYHSRNAGPGHFNDSGYTSAEADKLMDDAVATTDQAKRKDIYKRLQALLAEDQPIGVFAFGKGLTGINKRVKGYVFSPFVGTRYFAKDVFVTDGK